MATRPDDTIVTAAARLLERVRREGPILPLADNVVGVYSPSLANKVDKVNSDDLKIIDSLVDVLGIRKSGEPVTWREARSLLTEQSGKLSAPEHMKALHHRMREFLTNHTGREQDLTKLVWRTVSQALIPLAVDGLDDAGNRALIAEQEVRFRIQLEQKVPLWRILPNFYRSRAMTRAITRQLKHRLRTGRSRDDFAQALMSLVERIGLDRVTYLTTVQLIAISGVPGMMGACMVYGMHRYPKWHERIREEMNALEPDELYSLPTKKLPCTLRFIKEAMRLWTTPFVTRRVASRDIDIDGVVVKKGGMYELSSYIQHHSEDYWDDPEAFDPDRWLASRRPAAKGAYVPFGFGPRACVGASVGHGQLILFCHLVTRDFNVAISSTHEPWMRMEGFAVPTDFVGTVTRAE